MESVDRPYGDQDEQYVNDAPPAETGAPSGDLERDEEEAARRDAAAIGGAGRLDETASPDSEHQRRGEEFEAVEEAGGGQAEGFEQAEELHSEHAEHAPDADRTADAFDPDEPGGGVDPDAGDDPGAGPGVTHER